MNQVRVRSRLCPCKCKMMDFRCDLPRLVKGFAHKQAQLELVLPRE